MNILINVAVAAVFSAVVVVPFFAHRPSPSCADGTLAEPALQALAEPSWAYDCATQYAVVFIPQPENERAMHLAVLR